MSNFNFLEQEWPNLRKAAFKAEASINADPRAACFHARRTLELAVLWVYSHDPALRKPAEDSLSLMLNTAEFKALVPVNVLVKARAVKDIGNLAVHSQKAISVRDAEQCVTELFHITFWLASTYTRSHTEQLSGLRFDRDRVPPAPALVVQKTVDQLRKIEEELAERDKTIFLQQETLSETDNELKRLRAEIAEARRVNQATPVEHDYSEAETRKFIIDVLLKEAGWALDKPEDREYRVAGMPNATGEGFVDYVLWAEDGLPLALVEAKRTTVNKERGQEQAKRYADCLESKFGRRPIIFCSNGYETWLWDDSQYGPREVQGFYKRDELELLIQRRTSRRDAGKLPVKPSIADRHYQLTGIRKVCEYYAQKHRKALVVMATGAGKTRTVVALIDLLMRANWVKRALFLADRRALVTQAVNAFKSHLPESSPVNLLDEKEQTGSRVYVSTYPTMMGMINELDASGNRRFSPGHFDIIIVDEAHRSIYQKYRAIFDYFDGLLLGLTATPKDEVDRNTYRLFELPDGDPTFAYELSQAVEEGYLLPPKSMSVPVRFPVFGVAYDDLSEDEKEEWDLIDWDESGATPSRVEPEAVNSWFFNADTVDKVLETVMTKGQKVAGGDRLAKTIVFAKNYKHALFIQSRFDSHYPEFAGKFARIIAHKEPYSESLLEDFKSPSKEPHIAISVDMLDTGVDVPEVANLVFFKSVKSKTKFFQMVGRGTRTCRDLFGPSKNKEFFLIFDCCRNFEFFRQNPESPDSQLTEPLTMRLFKARVDLVEELRNRRLIEESAVMEEAVNVLKERVSAMNLDNFVVRPHRRVVEKFQRPESWSNLKGADVAELRDELSKLPSQIAGEDESAKQFDLLVLRAQLALLRSTKDFVRWQNQIQEIAALLEEKKSIPMVRAQLELLEEIQTDDYWADITVPLLDVLRKRVRELVKFIEKRSRKVVYADFRDTVGEVREVESDWLGSQFNLEQYKKRMKKLLSENENHIVVNKLKRNIPISIGDIAELERLLLGSGQFGQPEDFERVFGNRQTLGQLVRSMIGLDREEAMKAFNGFLEESTYTTKQILFVKQIVDYLTQNGIMDPAVLYESPFTDFSADGLDGVFPGAEGDLIVQTIEQINNNAAAA